MIRLGEIQLRNNHRFHFVFHLRMFCEVRPKDNKKPLEAIHRVRFSILDVPRAFNFDFKDPCLLLDKGNFRNKVGNYVSDDNSDTDLQQPAMAMKVTYI